MFADACPCTTASFRVRDLISLAAYADATVHIICISMSCCLCRRNVADAVKTAWLALLMGCMALMCPALA